MIPGELVNLRAIERDDVPIVYRWLNDPLVMRGWGFGATARSVSDVARDVEAWLAQESALGRPAALIAETLDGTPIGLVILHVERPEARSLELSFLVGDPSRWGEGLGADILRTVLETCFESWGVHRLGVRVEEDNERALALYRRFSFQPEGRLREAAFRDGNHADILLFALLASQWRADGESPADGDKADEA
jgi:RimJ/RimL family protein N-acetyltransferase